MRRALVLFFLVASVTAFACKEDENRPRAVDDTGQPTGGGVGGGGGGSDGGGGDGGVDTDADSATSCNTLTNDGNVVEQNRIVGDPQTGTGGAITDGTYELTAADLYVGAGGVPGLSGVTYQGVMTLTGTALQRVTKQQANQGATPIETRLTGQVTAVGTTITVTQSCPAPFQDQYTYSVLNNTLNLTSLITKESFTFTRR